MKAISLWQFWASAIALGLKRNETRSWSTNYRGPIAIHAAKRDSRELRSHFDFLMCRGDFGQAFRHANMHCFTMLPKGAVVALAELVDVVPTEVMLTRELASDLEINLGDYSFGRFAWRLENIRALPQPYFIAGHQGFFDVPEELDASPNTQDPPHGQSLVGMLVRVPTKSNPNHYWWVKCVAHTDGFVKVCGWPSAGRSWWVRIDQVTRAVNPHDTKTTFPL